MPIQAPLSALFGKRTADLSSGYYTRGAQVAAANRSRYNELAPDENASLSMSIVQAILAVLSQHVETVRYSALATSGTAWLWSTSRPGLGSVFTWDMSDPETPTFGGFVNGLTYQLVVLHLLWCLLAERLASGPQSGEVAARWLDLLASIEEVRFTRGEQGGWSNMQVATMCRSPTIQPHLERVADALWFSLRYQLPDRDPNREVRLSERNLFVEPASWEVSGPGADLLTRTFFSRVTAKPRPLTRPARLAQQLVPDSAQSSVLEEVREKREVRETDGWTFPDATEWLL